MDVDGTHPSEPVEPTRDSDSARDLAVFVYGTLKEGVENHAHFCRGATSVHTAWTWGRLYLWAPHIPILEVPAGQILMRAGDDVSADLRHAVEWTRAPADTKSMDLSPTKGWRRIRGQVIVFPDAERRLGILDAYEGFRPRTPEHYERVLIPTLVEATSWMEEHVRATWVYVLPEEKDRPEEFLAVDAWEPGSA